jgi:hypothetical protein
LYSALQAVEPNWEVTTVWVEPQCGQPRVGRRAFDEAHHETSGAGRVWGGAMP